MLDFNVFESCFKYSPLPAFIFLPIEQTFTIQHVNNAYLNETQTIFEQLLGKKIEDAFPPTQNEYIDSIQISLLEVLNTSAESALNRFCYFVHNTELNKLEPKFFTGKNTPIFNNEGDLVAIIHHIEAINEHLPNQKTNNLTVELKAKESIKNEAKKEFGFNILAENETVWEWDIVSDQIVMGENYHEIFEYAENNPSLSIQQWKNNIHPYDAERVLNGITTLLASASNIWQEAYRIRKGSGEYAYVQNRGFLVRNEEGKVVKMVGLLCDISNIKAEHDRLKLLESVIVNLNDSILITEAEPFDYPGPKIIYANAAFEKMTGYTLDEIIGQTPRILQGEKTDKNELARLSKALRNWETCKVTLLNYKKSGEEFWLSCTVTPVADENGWYTHWIAIERDVTDIVQSKKYLEELNAQLKQKVDELSMSNKELEQFAYIASHDLQEPLRMISGFLSQIERKYGHQLDEIGKQYIHFAVDGAVRMRQIILDLLAYSRTGRIDETKQLLDLNQLIDEVKILFHQKIVEKNAVLNIENMPTLYLSKVPMRQVFQNLIGNALKYSKNDIPTLIHVSAIEHKNDWEFKIQDNGIGIEKEYYNKVFLIFQRLHARDEYEGSGLGLAVTKKVIDSLGGKIWVESEVGVGSSFIFTIPKYQTLKHV